MNLTALQQAVDYRSGIYMDPTAQIGFINAAIDEITAMRDWPWLSTTQTLTGDGTTTSFALPAKWMRTEHVVISGALEARFINRADMDRFNYYEDQPTQYVYTIDGANIVVKSAIPAGTTAVHRYIVDETSLAAGGDTPLLPDRFSHAVVVRAIRIMAEQRRDSGLIDAMLAEQTQWDKKMRDEQEQVKGARRIRVRNGYGW